MSFDLGVFYTERPITDEQAGERYVAYCEEDDLTPYIEPSPRVAAFVDELTKAYPQIDDWPDEERREQCPWSIAFDLSEGHVLMPMGHFWAGEMTEVITDLAEKHGLVCFCPQSGEILTAPAHLLGKAEARRMAKRRTRRKVPPPPPARAKVVAEVSRTLVELGFEPCGEDAFTRAINEEVTAYIGLPGRESRHKTEVVPEIGLCHHKVTDLVRRYHKAEFITAIPLTYKQDLRWLAQIRDPFRWRFKGDKGDKVAREIVAAIKTHALPFFDAHATLEPIVQGLLASSFCDHETVAGLYLLGRYEDALTYLEARLTAMLGDDQHYNMEFRRFAPNLIEEIEAVGWVIDPEQRAHLMSLIAPKKGLSRPHLRERPFMAMLDELLVPEGFGRSGLTWQRKGRHVNVDLQLETGDVDTFYVGFDFRVFGKPPARAVRDDVVVLPRVFTRLPRLCSHRMANRLKRALCFHHDHATSGVLERERGMTKERAAKILKDMEPEKPLTMEWRLSVLREAVEKQALPLFHRLETSSLARFRLAAAVFIHGFDLHDRGH